jgi:hypothetical protein
LLTSLSGAQFNLFGEKLFSVAFHFQNVMLLSGKQSAGPKLCFCLSIRLAVPACHHFEWSVWVLFN